jgi:hypothetical protein
MRCFPFLLLLALLWGCSNPTDPSGQEPAVTSPDEQLQGSTDGFLVRIFEGEAYEMGAPCGYRNQQTEIVVPIGKYGICWTDTIYTFGIVADEALTGGAFLAIDTQGEPLYEVYTYDNGPDWIQEGLFRMMNDGKIGYADADGVIQIEPQFACAEQFQDGVARVAIDCELVPDGEYMRMESEAWFYIDTNGNKVAKK